MRKKFHKLELTLQISASGVPPSSSRHHPIRESHPGAMLDLHHYQHPLLAASPSHCLAVSPPENRFRRRALLSLPPYLTAGQSLLDSILNRDLTMNIPTHNISQPPCLLILSPLRDMSFIYCKVYVCLFNLWCKLNVFLCF
jgi:hypothetical protein